MKIAILNMFFTTPKGKWSTRVYDISRYLVNQGHEVHVITAKYYKSDLKSNKFLDFFEIDGIKIHLINIENNNKHNLLKRSLNFLLFTLFAHFKILSINANKFIFSSGPITVFINAFFYSLIHPKKTILEIRDLWPEGIEELRVIKSKIIIKFLKYFVKTVYNKSNKIVVLSEGMKSYLIDFYKIPASKITVATNFADFNFIDANIENEINIRIPDKYFLYYGNIGNVNNILEISKLFKSFSLKEEPHCLFIGDGQLAEQVKELSENYSNIHFHQSINKNELIPIISKSIACFVPLQEGLIMDTSSPNKLFESIGCGSLVLHNTNGWIKSFVNDNKFGYYFDLNNQAEIIKLILDLNLIPENDIGLEIKKRAKLLISKDVICEKIKNFILN
jgi:glycosyltransferase involved in cell wall biosynthesis